MTDVPSGDGLLGREKQVLNSVLQGDSIDEIATEMYISTNTVRNHLRNVAEKLRKLADRESE